MRFPTTCIVALLVGTVAGCSWNMEERGEKFPRSEATTKPGVQESLMRRRGNITIDDVVEEFGHATEIDKDDFLIGLAYEFEEGYCFKAGFLYSHERCTERSSILVVVFDNRFPNKPERRTLIKARHKTRIQPMIRHELTTYPVIAPAATGLVAGTVAGVILRQVFDDIREEYRAEADEWLEGAPGKAFDGAEEELEARAPGYREEAEKRIEKERSQN